jgi:uncharacterized membrane protein
MTWLATAVTIIAGIGAATIGGVFFVFSVAIMPAFARLAPEHGTAVMQAINVTIVRPPFLIVFVGTGLAGIAHAVLDPTAWVGAALYVLGGFGVTVVVNVPLNNRLATADPGYWAEYARRWTPWNHVRTVACIAAAIALLT